MRDNRLLRGSIEMILLGLAAWGLSKSPWSVLIQVALLLATVVPVELGVGYCFRYGKSPSLGSNQDEGNPSLGRCLRCHRPEVIAGQGLYCSDCSVLLQVSHRNRRIAGVASAVIAAFLCWALHVAGIGLAVLFILGLLVLRYPIQLLLDLLFPPRISVSGGTVGPHFPNL